MKQTSSEEKHIAIDPYSLKKCVVSWTDSSVLKLMFIYCHMMDGNQMVQQRLADCGTFFDDYTCKDLEMFNQMNINNVTNSYEIYL